MLYLYAMPGMYDDHLPLTGEDLRILELPDKWYPIAVKGSHNAKFYQAEMLLEDSQQIVLENKKLWSGGKIMTWNPEDADQSLEMDIPVEEAGNYTITFTVGKDYEGGSFKVKFGDTFLEFGGNETIDLYDPYRVLSRNFRSSPVSLNEGMNKILIIPAEANSGKIMLDFIWVMKTR